jgi:hypothetical protein
MTRNSTDIAIALTSALAILLIAWLASVEVVAESYATGADGGLPALGEASINQFSEGTLA